MERVPAKPFWHHTGRAAASLTAVSVDSTEINIKLIRDIKQERALKTFLNFPQNWDRWLLTSILLHVQLHKPWSSEPCFLGWTGQIPRLTLAAANKASYFCSVPLVHWAVSLPMVITTPASTVLILPNDDVRKWLFNSKKNFLWSPPALKSISVLWKAIICIKTVSGVVRAFIKHSVRYLLPAAAVYQNWFLFRNKTT